MEVVLRAVVAVGVNYVVHYGAATFYNKFCVPHTLEEVVQTLVTTASPVCGFAIGMTHLTQQNYGNILMSTLAMSVSSGLKSIIV